MEYDKDYVFFKSRTSFLLAVSILSVLFVGALVLQSFVYTAYEKMIVSMVLVIIAFVMNLTLGVPGFAVSVVLTALQLFLYIYRYFSGPVKDPNYSYMIELSLMSIALILMFQLFVRRVYIRISDLKDRAMSEYNRRITSETRAQIESAAQRTSLIVRHDEQAVEAVEASRTNTIDTLTTLPGRDMILDHIDKLIDDRIKKTQDSVDMRASEHPIYVIYFSVIDPVRFSSNLGHRTVDLFIQCMAHRMREAADSKDMVGRISGNEFAVVTSRDISEKDLFAYIDLLRNSLSENENSHVYSGYSQYPRDARYPGDLLSIAETAMRSAIASMTYIESYTSISPSNDSFLKKMDPTERHKIFDDIFDHNELHLVYQPCMDRDHKVVGFESFVRWESPVYGSVDTRDFLKYAEKTGHIFRVGTFVVKKALEELKRINKIYPDIHMTLNFSATQLKNEKNTREVIDLIKDSGCITSNIIMDIPEESLMRGLHNVRSVLEELTDMGVTLALDNFGRAYSSLNNIPLMPVSLVKLDGGFTSDLDSNATSKLLTSSIISLLNEIDISVDATGVETKEQFEALASLGCKYFQGKYLCDPIPEERMGAWVADNMIK